MTNSHETVWKEIWEGTKGLIKHIVIAIGILLGCAGAIGFLLKMTS